MIAFTLQHGIDYFLPLSCGLQNPPNTFQRAMDVALSAFQWQFALVSFVDIFALHRSSSQKIDQARHVLTGLRHEIVALK